MTDAKRFTSGQRIRITHTATLHPHDDGLRVWWDWAPGTGPMLTMDGETLTQWVEKADIEIIEEPKTPTAEVILFKASGKFYTEEQWRIPADAIGPYDMAKSPDFRRINGVGAVLVKTQEPWGYPHLFPGEATP